MPRSMPPRVLSLLHRHAADGSLSALLVAGGGALLSMRRAPALVDAVACPGLYDLAIVIAARTLGATPLSSILSVANALVVVVACALVARMMHHATGSFLVTVATGVAAASTPLFATGLSATPAVSVAVVAAAWLASRPRPDGSPSALPSLAFTIGVYSLAAAAVPALAVPAALVTAWIVWRARDGRSRRSRLGAVTSAAAVVLLAVAIVVAAIPSISGVSGRGAAACVVPTAAASLNIWSAATIVSGITPVVLALALLGLFSVRRSAVDLGIPLAIALATTLWSAGTAADHARVVAPAMLGIWVLAAIGLDEARGALAGSRAYRLGAAALILAVAVLQVVRLTTATVPADREPAGHALLSRTLFSALVAPMPIGAALVVEDAATDLLLRALPGQSRNRRHLRVVPLDADAIADLLPGVRVFALPRGQRRLQHLGFELHDVDDRTLDGLAEVRHGARCPPPLAEDWRDLTASMPSNRLALVASDDDAYGPVHVVVAAATPLSPYPLDWPPGTVRGFLPIVFNVADTGDRQRRGEDPAMEDLARRSRLPAGPHVVHLELSRVWGGPLILPIAMTGRPTAVLARLGDGAAGDRLRVCASFAYEVRPIGDRGTKPS